MKMVDRSRFGHDNRAYWEWQGAVASRMALLRTQWGSRRRPNRGQTLISPKSVRPGQNIDDL
jgi:hypothetical protein